MTQEIQVRTIAPWQNLLGWMGAASIVLAYALLTFDVLSSDTLQYNLLNLFGAFSLGYRIYLDRNWANLALEFFFAAVAMYALSKILFF